MANATNITPGPPVADYHHPMYAVLIATYTIVFIGGVSGAISMSFLLVKMNARSMTTAAIINLVVIHSLFLVTVPFRLYFYITGQWIFDLPFCKIVSLMAHFHMYLTLLFYVIALVIRWLIFFQWKEKVEFYRNLHAVATSAAVWILALLLVLPLMFIWYGNNEPYERTKCFTFQKELKQMPWKAVNYIAIIVVIAITCTLLGLQVFIIRKVVKKLSGSVWSHQEFWAQLKSLIFICFIIFCFLPHHFFRIYYIQCINQVQSPELEKYNEICLSITAISCLDLFLFAISGSKILRQKITGLSCC
ncbi:probable G-protein coupled receptor 141 [Tiliqua scincoides]|uniref:probable G-protein coupled receptor 141 n=1 Tax=Tiliqua scincoides TaxID=71010 RepID=UPI003462BBE5